MRSWLAGFLAFGLAYAVFVIAIFVVNGPTLQSPHLYGTLENKLPESARSSVIRVFKQPGLAGIGANYAIKKQAYELQDGSFTSTILVANGHVVVLEKDTATEVAVIVAGQYVKLIETHVKKIKRERLGQMLGVLLVPLVIFALFAFLFRWLWNKLLNLQ